MNAKLLLLHPFQLLIFLPKPVIDAEPNDDKINPSLPLTWALGCCSIKLMYGKGALYYKTMAIVDNVRCVKLFAHTP